MLVALNSNGNYVSLLDGWNREELEKLRKKESFQCPACKENVRLKLGYQKAFHFAHQSGTECSSNTEPETNFHLEGKKQLYQWLSLQYKDVRLEYYLSNISQRPDVYVETDNQKFAIEFQCSQISSEVFHKRTKRYLEAKITPIWILGADWIKNKSDHLQSLTSFEWQFASNIELHKTPTIPYYNPLSKEFIIITNLQPFSSKTTFCTKYKYKQNQLPLKKLLTINSPLKSYPVEWRNQKIRFRLQFSTFPYPQYKRILNALYMKRIPPFIIPAEAGIPISSGYWIETPIVIWQLWLLLDNIISIQIGEIISFDSVYTSLLRRISMGDIIIRKFPLILKNAHFSFVVLEYLTILSELGVLKKINKTNFKKVRDLYCPSNEEEINKYESNLANYLKRRWS